MARQQKRSVPSHARYRPLATEQASFLNVIFHGPFIFVFYPNRVEVLGADINEHLVGAGTWTREIPCTPGTYHLTGVHGQQDEMPPVDANTHAIIDAGNGLLQVAQESYYKFVLDKPSLMAALGLMRPEDGQSVFIGKDIDKVKVPAQFGSAHVLSYKIDTSGTPHMPQLEGLQWVPSAVSFQGITSINLHIFAESAFMLDLFHPNRDFASMVAMLPGLNLGLSRPFPDIEFTQNTSLSAPLGISGPEEGGLRGLPPATTEPGRPYKELIPPRICDAPSLVVINAADTVA